MKVIAWIKQRIRARAIFLSGLLLFLGASLPARAQEIPCEFEGVERIVAIGDVHGAYDRFVANLKATGLVDGKLRWTGGKTHLVQTGDVLDRGPHSRRAMDLLMDLELQAEAAGGRVHALIGNHEFWNVVGELGYVSPEEFAAFDGEHDRALRKAQSPSAHPGFLAHRQAFGAQGKYGQWIRSQNAAVKLNDLIFVHGGITREVVPLGLAGLNRRIRAEMDLPGDGWRQGLAYSDDGPLMTRRFSDENLSPQDEERLAPELQEVLDGLGARVMVLGHTVTLGLITPRFGGRVILIDTGMLDVYAGGHQAALLVEAGRSHAVHPKGKVELPPGLSGETGARYIEAVAAAAPDDDALKQKLARVRVQQGRLKEAAGLYREIGALDPRSKLPFTWRREAADCFRSLGETALAEKLYRTYLAGFRAYAESAGPGGTPLLHGFARECLRLDLFKEEALDFARRAASAHPANPDYQVTLGWAYLEKGEIQKASEVLTNAIQRGGDGFEARFLLGRTYARLGNQEKALEAFQAALRYRPGDRGVEEALGRLNRPIK